VHHKGRVELSVLDGCRGGDKPAGMACFLFFIFE
jgi:hypothetical protein